MLLRPRTHIIRWTSEIMAAGQTRKRKGSSSGTILQR
jgi:hypothetical protein